MNTAILLAMLAAGATQPGAPRTFEQLGEGAEGTSVDWLLSLAADAGATCTCTDEFQLHECRQNALKATKELDKLRGQVITWNAPPKSVLLGVYDFKVGAFPLRLVGPLEVRPLAAPDGCGLRRLCPDEVEAEQVSFLYEADLEDRATLGEGLAWNGLLRAPVEEAKLIRSGEEQLRAEVLLKVEAFSIRNTPNAKAEGRKQALVQAMSRRLETVPASLRGQFLPRLTCMKQIDTRERTAALRVSLVGIRVWRDGGEDYLLSVPASSVAFKERGLSEDVRRDLASLRKRCANSVIDSRACESLADRLSQDLGTPQAREEAERALQRANSGLLTACDKADATACRQLMAKQAYPERLQEFREKSCKGGDVQSCSDAAAALEAAAPTAASAGRASELWDAACRLGSARGCLAAGKLQAERSLGDKGQASFERGCEHGEAEACGLAARMLPATTPGVRHKRQGLLTKACAGGHDPKACSELGSELLADGKLKEAEEPLRSGCALAGPAPDGAACLALGDLLVKAALATGRAEAGKAYGVSCASGVIEGCQRRARLMLDEPVESVDAAELFQAFEASCRAGNRESCEAGSDAAMTQRHWKKLTEEEGKSKQYEQLVALSGTACKLGSDRMCARAAFLKAVAGTGQEYRGIECDKGRARACVAGAYALGAPGPRSGWAVAAKFYIRGCELGDGECCGKYAAMLSGGAASGSEEQAQAMAQKACGLGWKAACEDGFLETAGERWRNASGEAKH